MAVFYVKPASEGGNDANDGSTFALAKANLANAIALLGSGDELRVCSSQATPLVGGSGGSINGATKAGMKIVGADLIDGSPYDGSEQAYYSLSGSSYFIYWNSNGFYGAFVKDLYVTSTSSSRNGLMSQNNAETSLTLQNVTFDNFNSAIITNGVSARNIVLSDCKFFGCSVGVNLYHSTAPRDMTIQAVNCLFSGGFYGISINGYNTTTYDSLVKIFLVDCRFSGNAYGVYTLGAVQINAFNSIFANITNDGVRIVNQYGSVGVIKNSVFYACGGYGISKLTSTAHIFAKDFSFMDYNCFYNNGSGDVNNNFNGGTIPGSNNVTDNPLFVSGAALNEDFSLQGASPLRNVGLGFTGGR